jgi:tetratricopeptide (TPR) repeat protein
MNVKGYEKALGLLGKEKYKEAMSAFEKLVEKAESPQFREKCNTHIRYCNRKLKEPETEKSFDPFARAIFLINEQQFEESLNLLQPLLKEDPKNDAILYVMASAHAGKGDLATANKLLEKAIAMNSANEFYAEKDEYLADLQEDTTTP